METLTKMQKAFVSEYVKSLDAKASAIKAGYKKTNAKRQAELLLKNDAVIKEISALLAKQAQSLQVSKAYVVQRLLNIIEFSLAHEDILDKEGNKTGKTKLRDTQSSLRALDFLCKHLGLASSDGAATAAEPCVTFIDNLNENKI